MVKSKKCIGIIPARYKATRFEGKVIADLCGKPVIQHVYESAVKARLLDDVLIATDDVRIQHIAESFNAEVVFTSEKHNSGTERIVEVVKKKLINVDIIVNIQADEPLIQPEMINQVAELLVNNEEIDIATLRKKIDKEEEIFDPNVVKVVVDKNNFALYFSRSTIPHYREENSVEYICYKHIGIYGYRKRFLENFNTLTASKLEKDEKLEQLKILENGIKIKVPETQYETVGIDTKRDLKNVEKILNKISAD